MTAALPAASRLRERGLQGGGGGDGAQGEAAEQAVEPHPHAAAREALAAEQDHAGVEAEIRAEPQRIAPRGHGRQAVVADVVDEPAAAVQQDPQAEAQPRGALGRHPGGAGQAQAGGGGVDADEDDLPGQTGGAEAQRGVRDAGGERDHSERGQRDERAGAPERQRLRGSVGRHGPVVGAALRQVESPVDAVFKALRLRRGPRRWRPPGSACWRRACRWRCGRARAPWRGRCRGARRPPRPCCRRRAARRPGARAARGRPCRPLAVARCRLVTVAVAVGALDPAVAAQPRGEGGGVLLGVAQGGDVEQRRQHRAADGPRGHAHPAHAAVGALEAHDARDAAGGRCAAPRRWASAREAPRPIPTGTRSASAARSGRADPRDPLPATRRRRGWRRPHGSRNPGRGPPRRSRRVRRRR